MKHIILSIVTVLLLVACGEKSTELHGYAEGKFVMLSPETSGRIATLSAAEGAQVAAGSMLFQLEDSTERAALDAARANATAAAARFDDAATGGREPEIAAAREQLSQARAEQTRAAADRDRAQNSKKPDDKRLTRLQVMLSLDELAALDNFRFDKRMPSRASAIREILRRGLAADGFSTAGANSPSKAFGVIKGDGNSRE